MLVDPYADDTLVSDFVALAPEGIPVYVLADAGAARPSLKPGAQRWTTQWGAKRPFEVRLAPAKSLHDRLIITDGRLGGRPVVQGPCEARPLQLGANAPRQRLTENQRALRDARSDEACLAARERGHGVSTGDAKLTSAAEETRAPPAWIA